MRPRTQQLTVIIAGIVFIVIAIVFLILGLTASDQSAQQIDHLVSGVLVIFGPVLISLGALLKSSQVEKDIANGNGTLEKAVRDVLLKIEQERKANDAH